MRQESDSMNVGTADAYLRVAGGLLLLGLGVSRRLGGVGSALAAILGATKVAEGVTRYCPMLDVLGLHTREGTLMREGSEAAEPGERRSDESQTGTARATPAAREFPWETASEPGAEGTAGQRAGSPGSLRKPALTRRT